MKRTPVLGGGLRLPPARELGVAASVVAKLEDQWNTVQRVDVRLAEMGMLPNNEPDVVWAPVSTELLLTADIKVYTTMYAAQLRWYNYANRLLANVKAEHLGLKNQLCDLQVKARKRIRELAGKKPSVSEINDTVENDPSTLDLRLRKQELEQLNIKLTAWVEELDESKKVVSRQIELRRAENEAGQREGNIPNGGRGAWQPRRQGP